MFDQSIIKTSGQWPKLVAFFVGNMIGGVLIFAAVRDFQAEAGPWLFLIGMGLTITSFFFGVLAIRCPRCKARWLWQALSQQKHSEWLPHLLSHSRCPACSYSPRSESQVAGA